MHSRRLRWSFRGGQLSRRLLEAIDREFEAADALLRACARHGAIADATANDNYLVNALKTSIRAASLTPSDMLATLGKIK